MLKRVFSFILLCMVLFMQTSAFAAAQKRPVSKKQQTSVKKTYTKKNSSPKKSSSKSKIKKKEPEEPEFYIPPVPDPAAEALAGKGYKKKVFEEKIIVEEAPVSLLETSSPKNKYTPLIEQDEIPVCGVCADIKPEINSLQAAENESAVHLKPVKKISTKCKRIKVVHNGKNKKISIPFPLIGETVQFKVLNDVVENDKVLISAGSDVFASVGEVSPRGMGGVPAEMTIEKFYLLNDKGEMVELDGEVNSSGYTLAVWIGLVELATTPFLFGLAAPLLRVLPGGQAIVTPRKKYTVYYRT